LLGEGANGEPSLDVRNRVCASRQLQEQRQGCANGQIPPDQLPRICALTGGERRQLESAAKRMTLSGRALHRTLRVARTIEDLDGSAGINQAHIGEALAYRDSDLPIQ